MKKSIFFISFSLLLLGLIYTPSYAQSNKVDRCKFSYDGKNGNRYNGVVSYKFLIKQGSRGKNLKTDLYNTIDLNEYNSDSPVFLVVQYSNLKLGRRKKDLDIIVQSLHTEEYYLEVPTSDGFMPAIKGFQLGTHKKEQLGVKGSSRLDVLEVIYQLDPSTILEEIESNVATSFVIKQVGNGNTVWKSDCYISEDYRIIPNEELLQNRTLQRLETEAFALIEKRHKAKDKSPDFEVICNTYLIDFENLNKDHVSKVKDILKKIKPPIIDPRQLEKAHFKKIQNANEEGRIEDLVELCKDYREKFKADIFTNETNDQKVFCFLIKNLSDKAEKEEFETACTRRYPNGRCSEKPRHISPTKVTKPGIPKCNPGTPCDDENECTIDDKYDQQCKCIGTIQDTDKDGVCDSKDRCSEGDDNKARDGDSIPDACDPHPDVYGDIPPIDTTNVTMLVQNSQIVISGVEGGLQPYKIKVLSEEGVVINNLGSFSETSRATFETVATNAGYYTIRLQDNNGTFIKEERGVYLSPATSLPWTYIFLGFGILGFLGMYKKFIAF